MSVRAQGDAAVQYDMDQKIAEFRVNGYTVFEDLIPVEKIDRMREAFMALLDQVRERETEIRDVEEGDLRTGKGRLQRVHRYCMDWPLDPPLGDPEVYEHPVIVEFFERYFVDKDIFISCLHSNNPYPGSVYQNWHRDTKLLTPNIGNPSHPTSAVKVPLVDTCEENGSFEVIPGTQYLAIPEYEGKYNDMLTQPGFHLNPRRVNMKRGTVWMQDPRTIHRGTPNTSDHARPELCICFSKPWYQLRRPLIIHREHFEAMSERGRHLFRNAQLID
ncbi:MAG: hypothetical protein CMJ18_02605 [Phycisphaeraceae bacterium]|nr:hypothetical protein [Phycisphaeraceae bacterium]